MKCWNCGVEIRQDSNFCWNCGKRQKDEIQQELQRFETCEIVWEITKDRGFFEFFGLDTGRFWAQAVMAIPLALNIFSLQAPPSLPLIANNSHTVPPTPAHRPRRTSARGCRCGR